MTSRVAVIILNWNGWEDTIECLESVYQISYPSYAVIVVDNGSKDASIKKIKDYAEGKIKIESKFFNHSPKNKPIYLKEYSKNELESLASIKENIEDSNFEEKFISYKK